MVQRGEITQAKLEPGSQIYCALWVLRHNKPPHLLSFHLILQQVINDHRLLCKYHCLVKQRDNERIIQSIAHHKQYLVWWCSDHQMRLCIGDSI